MRPDCDPTSAVGTQIHRNTQFSEHAEAPCPRPLTIARWHEAVQNPPDSRHQEKPLFLTCNLLEPVDVTIILLSKAAKAANDA